MNKKGIKKSALNREYNNENQNINEDESEIPYRRSLIIKQYNDFKLIIQNQEDQIKEAKDEIKLKDQQLENEVKVRNELNSKIFDYERKINDLETINIFQKNEIEKKDKKILFLNQEIKNLKSKNGHSNDFSDQEAKDMIDHLSKELDEKDLEIINLKKNIQSLLKEKNSNTTPLKDDIFHSNNSNSEKNEQFLVNSSKQAQINKLNSKPNQFANTVHSIPVTNKTSSISPGKSSTSNYQNNSKDEAFEFKNNKLYKKVKVRKNISDKTKIGQPNEIIKQKSTEVDINNDLSAEKNTNGSSNQPRYKTKSPPKLDISSITTSQKLISPLPIFDQEKKNNYDYDEEEDHPNTARSAYPQNKNKILKNRKIIAADENDNSRNTEREFKSDDDLIKPKNIKVKRVIRKNKKITKHSTMPRVNNLKAGQIDNQKNESNNSDDDNNDSETSQSLENKRKPVRRLRKRSVSPANPDKNAKNNMKSRTQQINRNHQDSKNLNNTQKAKNNNNETKNNNFDESSSIRNSEEEDSQSLNEPLKANTIRPVKGKRITKKTIRKRVSSSQRRNEPKKNIMSEDSDGNDYEYPNKSNNIKRKAKKKRIVKKKGQQEVHDDRVKSSTTNNIKNINNDSSSSSLDSDNFEASQKSNAIQSVKLSNSNSRQNNYHNEKESTKSIPSTSNANIVRSRTKPKPRSKAKTINSSKQQLNNNQVDIKSQQSQPQLHNQIQQQQQPQPLKQPVQPQKAPQPLKNNDQAKPQNYGEGATIASRAAWLNNELFGKTNPTPIQNNNENLEEQFERVVAINKAIVRNPRRGVARRPPTILND